MGRLAADPAYRSHAHQHLSHRARGEYVDQLERVYAVLPRERVHVIVSERFFADPMSENARLVEFLELSEFRPAHINRVNASAASAVPEEQRRRLAEHYAPYNERLERLLGVTLPRL